MDIALHERTRKARFLSPILVAFLLMALSYCKRSPVSLDNDSLALDPPGITLSIQNGKRAGPLALVADQEYVFDRITLAVENSDIQDSRAALNWLRRESSFRVLNWEGVRETKAYWRNYRKTRPDADLFSHVFEGAKWISEPNALEISLLDETGETIGSTLRLSSQDFLNRQKQWDFDRIKAEYRYENFARHKDKSSARSRRTVAKIVFAVQTDLSKRLMVPAGARTLRVVWDKKPQEPYLFPVDFIPSPYGYGARLQVKVEPEKALYRPGDKLRATFTLLDRRGATLKFSEHAKNGIQHVVLHLDGPLQDPTFYHEEWLSDFAGNRFAYHLRAPALGLGKEGEAASTTLEGPPVDSSGTSLVADFQIPENLPRQAYGTFEINATVTRSYASQNLGTRFEKPIQVGQPEKTGFEKFGCASCHVAESPMDLGLLIPPMVGTEKLRVEDFQACVMCHDNSRNGSRRLDKYLHLIHANLDNFPVPKNNCAVCHVTAGRIRNVGFEVCSNCHENLHDYNQAGYTDQQCQACHTDYGRGHIVSVAVLDREAGD